MTMDMDTAAPAVDLTQMANAIRALSMDAVEAAGSGHPGMPMGMADVASVLFTEVLKFDADDPRWPDRDRFVLSAGHGSMLLYALGYLLGYPDSTLEDIKRFRQLGAPTAGHPEYGHLSIVETTTGPLGQGLGNAVGMAIAEARLRAQLGSDLVDHRTFCIAGDGCLMEGISQEAISLAGHLGLDQLVVLWDDNEISIDGAVSLSDSTDQMARFAASGWATFACDGHDPASIRGALAQAVDADRPALVRCRTTIGKGAPTKAATAAAHGAPLGADEVAGAREALGWRHAPFDVPEDILSAWRSAGARGGAANADWRARYESHAARGEFDALHAGPDLPKLAEALTDHIAAVTAEPKPMATRKASQLAITALAPAVPGLVGGSADLTGSNNTKIAGMTPITAGAPHGRYIHYGIREHAMAAAMNGMALHGGVVPYGGTFLVFADYCRPSIRLAALMGLAVIYVFTHDSIGVGEDGPTHQPVEHLASLRAIPNLNVFRPADAVETVECWAAALADRERPSVIALTRQNLPLVRDGLARDNLSARGAYVLKDAANASVALLATGSEVGLAMEAAKTLDENGVATRVISIPNWRAFSGASGADRDELIGAATVRVAVEAGVRQGWDAVLRAQDRFVGMTQFGASGKGAAVFSHFGISPACVVEAARTALAAAASDR